MLDRIGPVVTAVSAAYVLAGRLIDEVNTTAETIAVLLFAGGVVVGALRALRAGLRFASKVNQILTLLEGLEQRLAIGDHRMSRIERQLGLPPFDHKRDAA